MRVRQLAGSNLPSPSESRARKYAAICLLPYLTPHLCRPRILEYLARGWGDGRHHITCLSLAGNPSLCLPQLSVQMVPCKPGLPLESFLELTQLSSAAERGKRDL